MREVRLVGMADDNEHILLTGPELGTVALRIDDRLKAAVLRDRRLLDQLATKPVSSLSVREIQARLRAGATAEDIAADAGVPVESVRRFAGPVLDERAHVAEEVRRVLTPGGQPLEEALDPDLAWDAARRDDGGWDVTATGVAGEARFDWDPVRRRLEPRSELAAIALGEPPMLEIPPLAPTGPALSLVRERAPSATSTALPGLSQPVAPTSAPAATTPAAPAPATERRAGKTDRQAEADGVAPGKRATVPSWDDILFGTKPPEA